MVLPLFLGRCCTETTSCVVMLCKIKYSLRTPASLAVTARPGAVPGARGRRLAGPTMGARRRRRRVPGPRVPLLLPGSGSLGLGTGGAAGLCRGVSPRGCLTRGPRASSPRGAGSGGGSGHRPSGHPPRSRPSPVQEPGGCHGNGLA